VSHTVQVCGESWCLCLASQQSDLHLLWPVRMFPWTSTLVKTPKHPWVLDALAPQNVWSMFCDITAQAGTDFFGGKASDKVRTAMFSHTWSTQAGFGAEIRELFARTCQLGSLYPARTPLNTDNSSYLALVASQGLGWGGVRVGSFAHDTF